MPEIITAATDLIGDKVASNTPILLTVLINIFIPVSKMEVIEKPLISLPISADPLKISLAITGAFVNK